MSDDPAAAPDPPTPQEVWLCLATLEFDVLDPSMRDPARVDLDDVAQTAMSLGIAVPAGATGQACVRDSLPSVSLEESARLVAMLAVGVSRGPVPDGDSRDWADERSSGRRPGSRPARRSEILIVLEPIRRCSTNSLYTREVMALIGRLGEENVGVLLDTFQLNIDEADPAAEMRDAAPRLYHVRAVENNRRARGVGASGQCRTSADLRALESGGVRVRGRFTGAIARGGSAADARGDAAARGSDVPAGARQRGREMDLHTRHEASTGLRDVIGPGNSAGGGLELALVRLGAGASVDTAAAGRESLLTILGGRCSVTVDGMGSWHGLGDRANVFAGVAASVYVPSGVSYRIAAEGPLEAAIWRAPAEPGGRAYVIAPSEVAVAARGSGAFRRRVHTILDASRPAQRLVVGETFNEPGAWSSYPPHKHDRRDPPNEAALVEVYHYKLDPPQGFGVQRVYSPERGFDATYVVQDGDTVVIPFGYHPVVAAPGYRLCYLWALAGEGRELRMQEDPAHSWAARAG